MHVGEMKITLPQTEDRWGAPTAQAWASFPSPTGLSTLPLIGRASINLLPASRMPQSLEQVTAERNWETSWTKTGTLGKQAIVQLLLNSILTERNHPWALLSSIKHVGEETRQILEQILLEIDQEEQELPTIELKASIAHRVMTLSALMLDQSPIIPLIRTPMKLKYQKFQPGELAELLSTWNDTPHQGRLAVNYGARLVECIRSTYCTHFCVPVFFSSPRSCYGSIQSSTTAQVPARLKRNHWLYLDRSPIPQSLYGCSPALAA